ncbi:protein MpDOXC10 [Marchantia polymorpha subsp. ruderalis]|uniref:Fe2OG dioxygenase domain-containing protein n=2 Tax=Marchantia polymorpha TaxID=3197 RepID=A0A176W5J5_MARPO|nr:hypothetical protein AXG93_2507s1120 [Marchantia polymorpha subsp. ruderalis]PTQ27588.1 hypothetical protein MARPO_0191s0006 [Marchantia polymorpha]PTQ27589.1 hypothetical protein MARPO_0191s0006 [Marchantia polymorpha]BBN03433.1 hypothetical protein Mp_2g23460 [Marchantia polymorpha subsp. ruderalis]BBN03434.1 hypothetical protein Mp_2g23460 [Marchantia polymorpha subsp. ruderalis]|eukprot:PTQ27588.1 hypothetical protein MARPO_0191s0006 [Marchantia polymorpha]
MGIEDSLVERFENTQIKDDHSPPALDPSDFCFVLEPEFRPKLKHNEFFESPTEQIPVIDLAPIGSGDEEGIRKVIREVGNAAEEWGFFQVVNHGVPASVIDNLEEQAIAFFTLPLEEKKKINRTFEQPMGYYNEELTKNYRDWKEVFDYLVRDQCALPDEHCTTEITIGNQWPQNPSSLRDACEIYAKATEELAFRLLKILSQSLGLPAEHLHQYFEKHISPIRLNYYPVCPIPELALGVSRHKDPSAFTILVQDEVGGLQVRRRDGKWIGVRPRRDAFVINIGAVFQMWSNDRYQSVEHQVVVNENKARLSFPFFFNPVAATNVVPVPELLSENSPARYRPMNYGYFMRKRNDGNFKQDGEDIQIEHFAVNQSS